MLHIKLLIFLLQPAASTELPQLQPVSSEDIPSLLNRPTLQLLKRFPTKSEGNIDVIKRIQSKHAALYNCLVKTSWYAIIRSIEVENRTNPYHRTEAVIQWWMYEEPNPSWETFVNALRKIGHETLAQKIEASLHLTM